MSKYTSNAATATVSTSITTTSVPNHFVATYDGTTVRFYVNGVMAGSGPATIVTTPGTNFLVGSYFAPIGSSLWQGTICNVATYSTALTGTQVASLYAAI
jgi:hypothetical protein